MTLSACRQCGTVVPAYSQACPKCGARLGPVPDAAYRPPPPRPPEQPERAGWVTVLGWVALVGFCALIALFLFRLSRQVDQREAEAAEVARERDHIVKVSAWLQDTAANAPLPESGPAPKSERAKRMWVVSRMLVDRDRWEREVLQRHGVAGKRPEAWGTPRYWANARSYPEVGRYLEHRVAAIEEFEKTSAAWMGGRAAALARESGMSAEAIRGIFPRDFGVMARDDAWEANAMLEIHREAVRMDPRVHHAGGNELRWESEADVNRFGRLLKKLNDASNYSAQARQRRNAQEVAALSRVLSPDRAVVRLRR
ncbi:MAG TPA: zinc ribbon domain-containing protein [Longimicrobium sp.]|nr:zinc ribbon domain-containing protein [Longimicrobium sp.]